jgi:hypothetical protein
METQKYVIVRTCKNINRKTILHKDITDREEARRICLSYPTTKNSMVFFDKQNYWETKLKT